MPFLDEHAQTERIQTWSHHKICASTRPVAVGEQTRRMVLGGTGNLGCRPRVCQSCRCDGPSSIAWLTTPLQQWTPTKTACETASVLAQSGTLSWLDQPPTPSAEIQKVKEAVSWSNPSLEGVRKGQLNTLDANPAMGKRLDFVAHGLPKSGVLCENAALARMPAPSQQCGGQLLYRP